MTSLPYSNQRQLFPGIIYTFISITSLNTQPIKLEENYFDG